MGLMESHALAGQLVVTPHPVLLDGQRHIPMDLRPGESLYAFLQRHITDLDGQGWTVAIGGRVVPRHLWHHVKPKDGQVIEVRGAVGENALYIIAYAALIYFTFGFGAATAGAWGAGAIAGSYGALAATAVYVAGSIIINKVLGPKAASASTQEADSVYSLSGARNQSRPYEPLGLLFGSVRIAPDIASSPYTWYQANDQYLGMVLTPGINVDRMDALYNGDALLSSFEGVQVFTNGMPGMPQQDIPLYSNADTVAGGELDTNEQKGVPSAWVQRTTSANTLRIQVELEYLLFDTTSKGKPKQNNETIQVQYCPAGTGAWAMIGTRTVSNDDTTTQRTSIAADVGEGQYDVRVRIAGINTDGSGATAKFTWSSMTSVQRDTATYAGIARIGLKIKATGQLNGAPDEVRGVFHQRAMPIWRNGAWTTATSRETGTSNPGAQMLQYARGFFDENGKLIAGMGLADEQIDIEAFKGFMQHCESNGYTYDFWVRDARSHDDVLDAIALAGFGEKTWAGGRFSVAWAGDEQPLSGVVNMATIKKASFQVDYTLANAADGIEYTYFDRSVWDNRTLRVAAPGVETMLNPARVTGEGITDEARAAEMARYHLAQSLYQYKDISYNTDIECLSYRRLSMLALQHDLTQWGYGGRIRAATMGAGRLVTLQLDDPVPAPGAGNAYIGLRIPGEKVYRVFNIQPFAGERTTIVLADPWPEDAALPGDTDGNPAHDTIWVYDFKQTPGYRVRVVAMSPEGDLHGAKVSVVPEPPELWVYVKTGAYVPPEGGSSLNTRPVASSLQVSEDQVIVGDVAATDLVATFEITGPFDHAVVYASADGGNGELQEVAQTRTRTARWRIPRAGTYTINVRPFNSDGAMGVGASIIYTTIGADAPPVNFDIFNVEELSGGIRRYSWGFFTDTIQSANLAGAEVRYLQAVDGVPAPAWDSMTPVGSDGYHTAAFDSPIPTSGNWTFAVRARNTNGTLSVSAKYLTSTLGKSTGELFAEQQEATSELNLAITKEIQDRLNADVAAIQAAAEDATAKANAARDAAIAHADVIGAQVADIIGADEWITGKDYPKGDLVKHGGVLYRALRANNSVEPGGAGSDNDWMAVGNYDSLGEAVAASISMGTANASAIASEAQQLDAVQARMPIGNGTLATEALVATEQQARAEADTALAGRASTIEARMPTGSDKLANEARVVAAENASVGRDNALGIRVDGVIARLPTSGNAASEASVTQLSQAMAAADTALGLRVDSVQSSFGSPSTNLLTNPTFEKGFANWSGDTGVSSVGYEAQYGYYAAMAATGANVGRSIYQELTAGTYVGVNYWLSADVYRNNNSGNARLQITAYNGASALTSQTVLSDAAKLQIWQRIGVQLTLPANTTRVVAGLIVENTTTTMSFRRVKLERAAVATPYTDDLGDVSTASAISTLRTDLTNTNGVVSSQAQAITLVQTKQSIRPNLLPNGGFERGRWTRGEYTVMQAGADANGMQMYHATPGSVNGGGHAVTSPLFPASEGTYAVSFDTQLVASSGSTRVDITFYNASNQATGSASSTAKAASFLFADGDARRQANTFTATAGPGTTQAEVRFIWENVTGASNIAIRQVKVEKGGSPSTTYTSEAMLSLTASAQAAAFTLALNVNGLVSGITSTNNGTTTTFDVVADTFRIVAPSGGERLEYSSNNLRVYDANGVLVARMGRW